MTPGGAAEPVMPVSWQFCKRLNYQFEKARKCRYNLAGRVVEFTNTKANGNRL
jgi:hypothetical protein